MSDFWDETEDGMKGRPVSDAMIRHAEKELGYKLPQSYINLLRSQNGGTPRRLAHPSKPTSWATDHIAIDGILGIDDKASANLLNTQENMIGEWEYPKIGVYICTCPSGGHDAVCLDYSECGPQGEPRVTHVDQEFDYKQTVLAPNFAAFLEGLYEADE